MRERRGVAMLVALWMVVAIAVVALQFATDAKERRVLGTQAAERGRSRAAAGAGLAMMQARLEQALRQTGTSGTGAAAALRASDPWLDVDSVYSGPLDVDSNVTVTLRARDLGSVMNINLLTEDELRTFLGYVLQDYAGADQMAQSILDWRDADDQARPRGGERDLYLKEQRLALPANAQFREVEELLQVNGVTPAVYAKVSQYLTTHGNGAVNLNTAPAPVLRSLPGMSDAALTRILAMRSQGRRIQSVAQVLPQASAPPVRPGASGPAPQTQASARLQARTTVNTTSVELTLIARAGPQAQPVRLSAIIDRAGNNANISWKQW